MLECYTIKYILLFHDFTVLHKRCVNLVGSLNVFRINENLINTPRFINEFNKYLFYIFLSVKGKSKGWTSNKQLLVYNTCVTQI